MGAEAVEGRTNRITTQEAEKRARKLVDQMTIEERASQLKYDAPPIERLNIPAYNWWNEALHGVARGGTATMFPQAIGMAAMFDEHFMEVIGNIIATEGRNTMKRQSMETGISIRESPSGHPM